jgi:hypothetical protein
MSIDVGGRRGGTSGCCISVAWPTAGVFREDELNSGITMLGQEGTMPRRISQPQSQALRDRDHLNEVVAGHVPAFQVLLSALIGSFVAALADYLAKDAAHHGTSVVLLIQQDVFFSDIPPFPYMTFLLLMMLAAAFCYVFDAGTKVKGFLWGLSVVSVLMTPVSTKTLGSLPIKRAHADHICVISSCAPSGFAA